MTFSPVFKGELTPLRGGRAGEEPGQEGQGEKHDEGTASGTADDGHVDRNLGFNDVPAPWAHTIARRWVRATSSAGLISHRWPPAHAA